MGGEEVVLVVVIVLIMLLVEEVMALVVVMAVPTVDMGKVTVVMGRDGGDDNSENYRCLPAQLFVEAILHLCRCSGLGHLLIVPYTQNTQ